jgi:hypothetical protein
VLTLAGCGVLTSNGSALSRRSRADRGKIVVASHVFGRRYCELLLVRRRTTGFTASVFNSYGLGDCPAPAWNAIDTAAVAKANHVLVAVRNGPRFWAMDSIEKHRRGREVIKDFGGIRMIEEAVLSVTTLNPAPYSIHRVDRATTFVYDARRTVYELRARDGAIWVMQSWSRGVDPTLSARDLPHLASRLELPAGWTYRTRRLRKPLELVTVRTAAEVLQDNLGDTYSRLSAPKAA